MGKSSRRIARLYTTIDLGSVMNLSALPPTDELDDVYDWDGEDVMAFPSSEPEPVSPAWPPARLQRLTPGQRVRR